MTLNKQELLAITEDLLSQEPDDHMYKGFSIFLVVDDTDEKITANHRCSLRYDSTILFIEKVLEDHLKLLIKNDFDMTEEISKLMDVFTKTFIKFSPKFREINNLLDEAINNSKEN